MTIEKEIRIKISADTGTAQKQIDDLIKGIKGSSSTGGGSRSGGGGTPKVPDANKEVMRETDRQAREMKSFNAIIDREIKKTSNQFKEKVDFQDAFEKRWRKTITGILIDLHVIRIMGQHSMIVSNMFQLLARSLGVLVDIALVPLIPSIVMVAKFFFSLAALLQKAPIWFRLFLGFVIAAGLALFTLSGYFVLMNVVVKGVTASLIKMGLAAETNAAASGGSTLMKLGPVGAGIGLGLIGVAILHQTGVLKMSYDLGKKQMKFWKEDFAPRITKIGGAIASFLISIWDVIRAVYDWLTRAAEATTSAVTETGSALADYGLDTLSNVSTFISGLINAILDWIRKSLENYGTFVNDVLGVILGFFKDGDWGKLVTGLIDAFLGFVVRQFTVQTDAARRVIDVIVRFVYNQFKDTLDLAREIKDIIVRFFNKLFPGVGDVIGLSIENIWNATLGRYIPNNLPEYNPEANAANAVNNWWDKINMPQAATGGYVAKSGVAVIHQGETVIPKDQAGLTINAPITVYGSDRQYADFLVQHLKNELRRTKGVGI